MITVWERKRSVFEHFRPKTVIMNVAVTHMCHPSLTNPQPIPGEDLCGAFRDNSSTY
jgi:hypothetical protein